MSVSWAALQSSSIVRNGACLLTLLVVTTRNPGVETDETDEGVPLELDTDEDVEVEIKVEPLLPTSFSVYVG